MSCGVDATSHACPRFPQASGFCSAELYGRPEDGFDLFGGPMVRHTVGPVAAFKLAVVVDRLPKTRSGKILRATMVKIADGEDYKMPATIDDPAILDEIGEVSTEIQVNVEPEMVKELRKQLMEKDSLLTALYLASSRLTIPLASRSWRH